MYNVFELSTNCCVERIWDMITVRVAISCSVHLTITRHFDIVIPKQLEGQCTSYLPPLPNFLWMVSNPRATKIFYTLQAFSAPLPLVQYSGKCAVNPILNPTTCIQHRMMNRLYIYIKRLTFMNQAVNLICAIWSQYWAAVLLPSVGWIKGSINCIVDFVNSSYHMVGGCVSWHPQLTPPPLSHKMLSTAFNGPYSLYM